MEPSQDFSTAAPARAAGLPADAPAADPSRRTVAIILLVVFIDLLGFGVIVPLLPFYGQRFGASDLQVGVLFALYSLAQFVASPLLGWWSDRIGRRPVILASLVVSVVGYVLLGLATDLPLALGAGLLLCMAARLIAGVGAANLSAAQAAIADVTPPKLRGARMGLVGAAFGVGFTAGPLLGGLLGSISPSLPAYVAAAFSLAALVTAGMILPETRRTTPAAAEPMPEPEGKALLHAVPPRASGKVLSELTVLGFFGMFAFVMMETTIAIFLARADTFAFDKSRVGYFFAFIGLMIVITQGGLVGPLIRRLGERRLAAAGMLLVAVAMAMLGSTAYAPALGLLILAAALNALGRGTSWPAMTAIVSRSSSDRTQGAALGRFSSAQSLARVVGPVAGTGLLQFAHGSAPFFAAAAIAAVVGVATLLIPMPAVHADAAKA